MEDELLFETPNGSVITESEAKSKYGDRFQGLVDSGTFKQTDKTADKKEEVKIDFDVDSFYISPNGSEIKGIDIVKKYGNRSQFLVDNGTLKKKDPLVSVSDSEVGSLDSSSINDQTELSEPQLISSQQEAEQVIEIKPTEVDENLLIKLNIDKEDYSKWEQETQREETESFKFIKTAFTSDEGEEFFKEKKDSEKILSYKTQQIKGLIAEIANIDSQLTENKEPKDKIKLLGLKSELKKKIKEEAGFIEKIDEELFPTYKKYTSDLDLERRKNLYVAGQKGGTTQFLAEAVETFKTIPTTASNFATGTFAFFTSLLDQGLTSAGADKKGVLAGATEALLDSSEALDIEIGAVRRSGVIDGKGVTVDGKEFIVTDEGDVLDDVTHVSVVGILPEEKIKKIRERSKGLISETFYDGGALLQSGVQTMANLFALIRSGKIFTSKIGGKGGLGMGLASYASTLARTVEEVRADLVKAGLTEDEALGKSVIAGNAIASLDGVFSGLAGGNTKILTSLQGIRSQIVDVVKKKGKDFSKKQLKDKIKTLTNENLKEVFIEELPVLFSEKGINLILNEVTDLDVRSSSIKKSEIIETVILTIGATSSLGAPNLIRGNKRSDAIRYIAKEVDNLDQTIEKMVNENQFTSEQGKEVYDEIYAMQTALNRTNGTIINSDNMLEASDLLQQRQNLVAKKEGLEGPLKEDIDKQIQDVDKQISSLKQKDSQEVKSEEQNEGQPEGELTTTPDGKQSFEGTIQEAPVQQEKERFRDSQVVKEAEVFEVNMEDSDGTNTTVEVRTNLDGSREFTMIIDGQRSGTEVSKENTLSNKDYIEASYGEVITSKSKPVTEVMNPKKIDALSLRQKKAVGLETTTETVSDKKDPGFITKPSIKEPFILRGLKGGITSTQINFNEEGKIESVVNKKTGKPVSEKARKRAEKEYLESIIDVNEGQRSQLEEGINPSEINQAIADASNNPKEVAEAIVNEEQLIKEESSEKKTLFDDDKLNPLIGVKFTPESWREVTGLDPSDFGLTKTWISKDGVSLKDGWKDYVGEENVTLEEVVEFMKNNPNAEALNILGGKKVIDKNTLTSLKEKFKKLTGVEATPTNIDTVINIDPNREPLIVAKEQAEVQDQREAAESGVFGKKKGPTTKSVTEGKPKKVTVDESKALKDQIKLEAKAARESVSAYRKAAKSVSEFIKTLKSKGKITASQSRVLLNKALNTNLNSEVQVKRLTDYVIRVMDNAAIVERLTKAFKKQKNIKKNIRSGKLGDGNNALVDVLNRLAKTKISLIPLDKIDSFEKLMNIYGDTKKVLDIRDIGADTADALDIINSINYDVDLNIKESSEEVSDVENYDIDAAIEEIKSTKPEVNQIEGVESQELAKEIINLTEEDIRGLVKEKKGEPDYSQIQTLIEVMNNLSVGNLPQAATDIMLEVNSNRASKIVSKPMKAVSFKGVLKNLKNLTSSIKLALSSKTPSGVNLLLDKVRSSPAAFIDNAFGNLNSTVIFDNTFGVLAKAYEKFKIATDRGFAKINLAEKALEYDGVNSVRKLARIGNSVNKIIAKKYKIRLLQIARENELNKVDGKDNPKAPSAKSIVDETLKYLKDNDQEADYDILKKLTDEFTVNGEIDLNKLNKSLTKGEKESLVIYDEVNASLADKAVYASSMIRSNRIELLNGYSHRVVLSNSNDSKIDLKNKIDGVMKPSTKSGTFIERTKGAKPISFDPSLSAQKGLQETNLDYYMTLPVKTVMKTVNKVEKEVNSSTSDKDKIKAAQALKKSAEEVVRVTFGETLRSSSGAEILIKKVKTIAYGAILGSVPRMGAEFLSNMAMVTSDPQAAMIGFRDFKLISITGGKQGLDILRNLGSSEGSKLYDPKKISSRFVESSDYTRTKSQSAKSSIANAMGVILNLGPKQLASAVDTIASKLMSTPDLALTRPMWFGVFAKSFKEETGILLTESDMIKIGKGDSKYLGDNYKKSIEKSVNKADKASVRASTTRNPFKGVVKNISRSTDSGIINAYREVNKFMANFSLFEYATARDAVGALQRDGDISKSQALGILTGVGARMTLYPILYDLMSKGFDGFVADALGFAIEDEEEEDIEDVISRQVIGTALTLLTRRSLGNIPNLLPAYGIEAFNKSVLEDFRKGEYDPFKHSIVYSQFNPDDLKEKGFTKTLAKIVAGPFGPTLNTIERANQVYGRSKDNKTLDSREKNFKELTERIPLEVLGNLGLVPFYKDVRRVYLKNLFSDYNKSKGKTVNDKQLREMFPDIYKDIKNMKGSQDVKDIKKQIRDIKKNL